jgi:hypothetical protein
MEEINDKEFELLLSQKRHSELMIMLNKIFEELGKEQESINNEVNVEIDTSKLENIIKTLNNAPDTNDIPKSIQAMGKVLEKHFKAMKFPEPVRKWKHTINRDNQGLYQEIISEEIKK